MTLIDRLSKLDGPDREVDREMAKIDPGPKPSMIPFDYTASVDECLALARRLWPDVMYRVGNHAEGYDPSLYLGEIFIPGETQRDYFTGVASSDAIALCIAVLRAKEASNGQ